MVRKEGGHHYAHFITAVFKPGSDGNLILCCTGAVSGAENEGESF